MHSFVGRHHDAFVPRQSLDLLLHVATLMRAPVVASATRSRKHAESIRQSTAIHNIEHHFSMYISNQQFLSGVFKMIEPEQGKEKETSVEAAKGRRIQLWNALTTHLQLFCENK